MKLKKLLLSTLLLTAMPSVSIAADLSNTHLNVSPNFNTLSSVKIEEPVASNASNMQETLETVLTNASRQPAPQSPGIYCRGVPRV